MENICQNCGMLLNNNSQLGALSLNANKNIKYCNCEKRQDGRLKKAGKKVRSTFNIEKMKGEGFPKFLNWLSSRGIKNLE